MEALNQVRVAVWRKRGAALLSQTARIDADGTMVPTTGECKQGIDIAYDGSWGYHQVVRFVFGYDAKPDLVVKSEEMNDSVYRELVQRAERELATKPRARLVNEKDAVVRRVARANATPPSPCNIFAPLRSRPPRRRRPEGLNGGAWVGRSSP